MKFFTVDLYSATYAGDDDDWTAFQQANDRYASHLATIADRLPAQIAQISEADYMHDGLLVRATYDPSASNLNLVFRCGWIASGRSESGYVDVGLEYVGARISDDHMEVLKRVAEGTKTSTRHQYDIFKHEMDISESGQFVHRLIFHNVEGTPVWIEVWSKDLRVTVKGRPDRELPRFKKRFRALD